MDRGRYGETVLEILCWLLYILSEQEARLSGEEAEEVSKVLGKRQYEV